MSEQMRKILEQLRGRTLAVAASPLKKQFPHRN
jgi:hypothetical protein